MNPGFLCTGQMANRVYGTMWESGLLIVGPAAQGGGSVMV